MTGVRELVAKDLKWARLFGSRARGEGHEYSDVDIALVVAPPWRARRYEIYDLAYDIGLEHRVTLAPMVIDEARFQELKDRERLIVQEIERDGIPV